jgi:hypothetical protein
MWKGYSVAEQETENQFSNMSLEHWKAWVTEQRQEYSQRVKSAHPTRESGSLSLGWMTPDCSDRRSQNSKQQGLSNQVKNWATPNTMDVLPARSPEKLAEAKKKGGCKNLREEVMNWPTVTVGEEKYRIKGDSQASKCLSAMAARGELGPLDQTNPSESGKNRGSWGTPQTSQAMSATITQHLANRGMGNLEEQQGQQSIGMKLNPNWVEQLMGLPVGWTDLGFWATESSQPQPLKPSLPLSKD